MDKAKIRALHEDLNKAIAEVAKKHGYASASIRTMSYTDIEATGRVRIVLDSSPEAMKKKWAGAFAGTGYVPGEEVNVSFRGKVKPATIKEVTSRGSLIITMDEKSYRIGPAQMHLVSKKGAVPGKPTGVTEELKKKFMDLTAQLEPENLTCDGECTQAQISSRRAQINRDWRALEAIAGRTVSNEEASAWWMAEIRG